MIENTIYPPLSLYCHLPWCIQKCPYCDFNSHTKKDTDSVSHYTDALCQDLIASSSLSKGRTITSIFFGGGTPSLFPPSCFSKILETIHKHYCLSMDCEITMEVNPHTYDFGWLSGYHELGINRASIGAQSFSSESLTAIGRTHTPDAIFHTFETLRSSGFININIDIMHGLPQQTMEEALFDIKQAIQLNPEHVSWYELTIEPNTLFAKHPPLRPDDDRLFEIFCAGQNLLQSQGFNPYEISAYAKTTLHQCVHNLNYWEYGDYIGCGAGAHAKITSFKPFQIRRYQKHKSPKAYQLSPQAQVFPKKIDGDERLFEYMLNALRLYKPIQIDTMLARTQIAWHDILPKLQLGQDQGLLSFTKTDIKLTSHGRKFLNDTQGLFM